MTLYLEKLQILLSNIKKQRESELKSSPTLYSFYKEYENYAEINLSPKYQKSIRLTFNHLINFFGESKILSDISVRNAEDFKTKIMERAPRGYSVYLRTAKASFNKALEWEKIKSNPFLKVKIRKTQETKPLIVAEEELQEIMSYTSNATIAKVYFFAFHTGCRLGEVIRLKWRNIDLDKRIIEIGDSDFKTKTCKQRNIPINKRVLEMLISMKKENPVQKKYVFEKTCGYPYNGEYISRIFKAASRAAGLDEGIHFHSLRHSFASHLAMRGVPLVSIKELLGHSSIITTQIYSHVNMDSLQKAVNQLV